MDSYDIQYDIQIARLKAVSAVPYMRTMILNSVVLPRPGLGTMAIDIHGRIYYDPEILDKWSLSESAGVVIHECLHWFLRHGKRAKEYLGDHGNTRAWNKAADMVVNQVVDGIRAVDLPPGHVTHKAHGFPRNLQVEEYYRMLLDKENQDKGDQEGQGSEDSQEGDSAGHGAGSGSDGRDREYEIGEPDGEDANYGHSEASTDRLVRATAQDMAQRAAGTIGHYLSRAVESILRPKWNPRQLLWTKMRRAVTRVQGYSDYTWSRPARNGAGIPCRMPDWFAEPPKPLVVIDTSGSMDQEDLGLALGVVKDVLALCQSSLVISGDTDIHTAKTVFSAAHVPLQGGGGTNMGAIMEMAEATYLRKGYSPCIVVTDGYTPWPSSRLKGKWIALVTQDTEVPSWITRVPIR